MNNNYQVNYLIEEYNAERKLAGLPYVPYISNQLYAKLVVEVLTNIKWDIIDSCVNQKDDKEPVITLLKKLGFKVLYASEKRENAFQLLPLINRIISEAERIS